MMGGSRKARRGFHSTHLGMKKSFADPYRRASATDNEADCSTFLNVLIRGVSLLTGSKNSVNTHAQNLLLDGNNARYGKKIRLEEVESKRTLSFAAKFRQYTRQAPA